MQERLFMIKLSIMIDRILIENNRDNHTMN